MKFVLELFSLRGKKTPRFWYLLECFSNFPTSIPVIFPSRSPRDRRIVGLTKNEIEHSKTNDKYEIV